MGKLSWMKFWPKDFIRDTRGLSPSAKGVWIDLICYLWDCNPRGYFVGDLVSLQRITGADENTLEDALKQFVTLNVADLKRDCNGNVTVCCRRMEREEKERENIRLRVVRHRSKPSCNANVTEMKRECNATCNGNVTGRTQNQEPIKENTLRDSPNPAVKEFIDFWYEKFKEKFGQPYVITNGAKEGNLTKKLLRAFKLQELKEKAMDFFSSDDEFIKKSGYTIPLFCNQINKFRLLKKSKWGSI
jgi:uncharacterized protein YdaU (DUF1376 family)